jgi:hypothetical protein
MTAAIYARISTDQGGVADDAKSVTRQIDRAKAYGPARAGRSRPGASIRPATLLPSARSQDAAHGSGWGLDQLLAEREHILAAIRALTACGVAPLTHSTQWP